MSELDLGRVDRGGYRVSSITEKQKRRESSQPAGGSRRQSLESPCLGKSENPKWPKPNNDVVQQADAIKQRPKQPICDLVGGGLWDKGVTMTMEPVDLSKGQLLFRTLTREDDDVL